MRRNIRLLLTSLVAVMLVALSGMPGMPVASAASSGGNGLRVSPVRTDLTIKPGDTQTVTITVTNVTPGPATLQASINDFVANPDESGNPLLLLSPTAFSQGHSLKRFVEPIKNFTVGPSQELGVPVTITVPKSAAGGGYYGAVRFSPAVTTLGSGQNVSLAGSVGTLILVKVPGNIVEKLSIASFDVRKDDQPSTLFTSGKKLTVTTRFQNEGNLQEEPFGKILLKNRSNKVLATYELNMTTPPGNVLPDSVRKFSIPLTHVGSLGEYKLEGNFGYGSSGQLLSAQTTFFVIPIWLIILFILFVLLLVFVIFVLPRLIRAYNRRVVRKARRGK